MLSVHGFTQNLSTSFTLVNSSVYAVISLFSIETKWRTHTVFCEFLSKFDIVFVIFNGNFIEIIVITDRLNMLPLLFDK